jgi:hypothetical protein
VSLAFPSGSQMAGGLNAAIKKEEHNIKRLVSAGAREYCIMTNVAGTAASGHGIMDRLTKILEPCSGRSR